MTAHLDKTALTQYLDRALSPADLLAVHSHVRDCEDCRDVLANLAASRLRVAGFPADADGHSPHLLEDELMQWVTDRAPANRRKVMAAHLAQCEDCSSGVAAMEMERGRARRISPLPTRRVSRPAVWALAAAALLLAGVVSIRWLRPESAPLVASLIDDGRTIGLDAQGALYGLPGITPEQETLVRDAFSRGTMPHGPNLPWESRASLRAPAAAPTGLAIVGPMNTVLLTDRPTFSWRAEPGPDAYEVVITSATLEPLARSGRTQATEWQPQEALPRGVILLWQVRAWRGSTTSTAPAPPAPPARFEIAPARVLRTVENLRAQPHPSHLLLAVVCAQAGLDAEARVELASLIRENPQSPVARKLLTGAP